MSQKQLAALVTGGGKGIGAAISRRLAKEQPVLMVGRTQSALVETQAAIQAAGGTAEYVVGDICLGETVSRIFDKLALMNWSVSSLVLNAGIGKGGAATDIPADTLREIFEVNVFAGHALIKLAVPEMIERRSGSIAIISSITGLKGSTHDYPYCASKHAQVGMARALAFELGKHGISVVPICPGFVESEMTERSISSVADRKKIERALARDIIARTSPQRRIIPAEEVAEAVAIVCSGKIPSLSGNPLILGGGAL